MTQPIFKPTRDAHELKQVVRAIRGNRRFVISTHLNPDWDGIGAGLALASLLKRLGKQVMFANDGGLPRSFDFLPRSIPVISDPATKVNADASVILDVPTFPRIGSMTKLVSKIPQVINIDHHVSNQRFGTVNWIDPNAASVGHMIFRLFKALNIRPTQSEAVCLYVSLVTDTGSFRYMNTTSSVHQIAADLIAAGVRPLKVAQQLYEAYSPADLKFLGKVLAGLKHTPDCRVAWVEVPYQLVRSTKAGPEIEDELVNYPRSIRTAEVAFVLRETKERGKIRVSFRSKGNINVDRIARKFHGGGHIAASGCTVEGNLAQARKRVLAEVRAALRNHR